MDVGDYMRSNLDRMFEIVDTARSEEHTSELQSH